MVVLGEENNRNEEVEMEVEEGNKKTLRRENNKIVEKRLKKIEERNKIEKGEG